MHCSNCHTVLPDQAAFCSNCGHALNAPGNVRSKHQSGLVTGIFIVLISPFALLIGGYLAAAFADGFIVGAQIRQQGGAVATAGIALFGMDRSAEFVQHYEQSKGGLAEILALSPTFKWGVESGAAAPEGQ